MPLTPVRTVYLLFAILGTLLPWLFFGHFFALEGFDLPLFARSLIANGAASGFSIDVLISIFVFLLWSFSDARERGVRGWWAVLPASALVGLSLALPLYLFLREGAIGRLEAGS